MASLGPLPPPFPPPSITRVYDYALGGKDNYPPDREVFEKILAHYPQYRAGARANRRFLRRTVDHLARRGVRQFLDLGSGIPTSPNVHEVARDVVPSARVVYADSDQTAWVHGQAAIGTLDGLVYVRHDVADIEGLLARDDVTEVLCLDEPLGVLAFAVLHFLDDDTVRRLLDYVRRLAAPGSHLAFSVFSATEEEIAAMRLTAARDELAGLLGGQSYVRTPDEVARLLGDLVLLEPGIVDIQDWPSPHPDPEPRLFGLGGVAELSRRPSEGPGDR